MQPQVVHEAEVHRQHVRLKVPIRAEIDGTPFTVDDWSMGGFGVEQEMTSRHPGETFQSKLTFPFEDFAITLDLSCQLVYIVDDNSRFGCRFAGLSEGQLALFRYVVDAYLSGEIVSAGDILAVRSRDNTADARTSPRLFDAYEEETSRVPLVPRLLGYAAVLALTVLVAWGAWQGFRERYLTVRSLTATVDAPVIDLRAPVAGTVLSLTRTQRFERGALAARIDTEERGVVEVRSPCECAALDQGLFVGQYIDAGATIFELVALDQPLFVDARLPLEDLSRVAVGDRVEMRIPGQGDMLVGQVEKVDVKRQPDSVDDTAARVVIRPDAPFALGDLGTFVQVTIR